MTTHQIRRELDDLCNEEVAELAAMTRAGTRLALSAVDDRGSHDDHAALAVAERCERLARTVMSKLANLRDKASVPTQQDATSPN